MHLIQDPKIGNDKKNNTFPGRVFQDYNKNGVFEQLARSLET
jgi:hypothetical protein